MNLENMIPAYDEYIGDPAILIVLMIATTLIEYAVLLLLFAGRPEAFKEKTFLYLFLAVIIANTITFLLAYIVLGWI